MGAGASAGPAGGSQGGGVFASLTAKEEAKTFYSMRIAEVIAKEFDTLKSKGHISLDELQHDVLRVLQKNEPYILEKPSYVTPIKSSPPGLHQLSSNSRKSARRRSFDNLVYDDVASMSPSRDFGRVISHSDADGLDSGRIKSFVSEGGGHYSSSDPEAQFSRLCAESVRQIVAKKNLTYMAAVDGSAGGHIAFQTMMMMRKKLDHVCLFHAYSKDNIDNLADEFRPDSVRARYEHELITKLRLPTTKFTFYWEEKKNRDIRKVIMQLLNNYKGVRNPMRPTRNEPNFFFCGYTGTKGVKKDNSTLGSVTDIALRSVHMPVIICKSLCSSSTRLFVIAVDGSEHSRNGFDIAMTLLNPKDTLHCVTVVKPSPDTPAREEESGQDNEGESGTKWLSCSDMSPAEIQTYYSTELRSYGTANSEFLSLSCEPHQSIAERLVAYSDSVNADFFAISPRAQVVLTSVTDYIICKAKANIILCKN